MKSKKIKSIRKPKTRSTVKPKSSRSNLAITLTLITIVIGILAYTYRVLTPQPIQVAEIRSSTGTVSISLHATDTTLNPNQESTIDFKYSSPTQKFTAIQAEIAYDPTLITPITVTPSSNFPTIFVAPKFENGKITFTYGVASSANSGLSGDGSIAVIKFKALKAGTAALTITTNTLAATEETAGTTTNMLKEVNHASVTIADPVVASPIASPQTSPQASPVASPQVSPQVSPQASPITSPASSPTASPISIKPATPTNLKYNCYSNGSMITLRWDKIDQASDYELILDEKSGSKDTTITLNALEKDISIAANSDYTWTLRSVKDSVKSDPATINNIKCSSTTAAASVTPSPSVVAATKATPKPTTKPSLITKAVQSIVKPKSPAPIPTLVPSPNQFVALDPTPAPGSLADVFKSPEPSASAREDVTKTSIFSKIFLGWQALFLRIVESFAN